MILPRSLLFKPFLRYVDTNNGCQEHHKTKPFEHDLSCIFQGKGYKWGSNLHM